MRPNEVNMESPESQPGNPLPRQQCGKCHHLGLALKDGICQIGVLAVSRYEYPCGCKCEFAPLQPAPQHGSAKGRIEMAEDFDGPMELVDGPALHDWKPIEGAALAACAIPGCNLHRDAHTVSLPPHEALQGGELLPCPVCKQPLKVELNGYARCVNLADARTVPNYETWFKGSCILAAQAVQMPTEAWQQILAARSVPEQGWLLIESAPKDGRTLLLGYYNLAGKWRTMRGQWYSDAMIQQDWEDPDDGEEGWYETSVQADDPPNCWRVSPTHWQPLPAPPRRDEK